MAQLNPYVLFNGTCEAALEHYKNVFNGEIVNLSRYKDVPSEDGKSYGGEDNGNLVMHATFKAGDIMFMVSDAGAGHPVDVGNNVQMSINCGSTDEQETHFNGLAEGGTVLLPLNDTFWGARFGMVRDKFGVNWMLNHDHK